MQAEYITDRVLPGDVVRAFHPGMFGVIREGRVMSTVGQSSFRIDFGSLLGGAFRVPRQHVTVVLSRFETDEES